jgi:hypothetical protein
MTAARRQLAPLRVTTTGSPADADLRGLAALLLKLDLQPPVRLVSPSPAQPYSEAPPAAQ